MSYTKITHVDRWLMAQSAATLESLAKHPLIADLYKSKVKQHTTHKPRPVTAKAGLTCTWLDARTVRITPEPPSANTIKGWLYHGRAKHRYAAYRGTLSERLVAANMVYVGESIHYRYQPGPWTITHTWVTVQPRDEDSFGTSLKPVLDALVDAGVLANDDPATVRLVCGGQTSGGKGIHQRRGLTLRFDRRPGGQSLATDSLGGHPLDGTSSLPHGNR